MSDVDEHLPTAAADEGGDTADEAEVTETGEVFDSEVDWPALGLSEPILKALAEMEYTQPTQVQTQAIPKLLTGNHLLVRSKTGTGKTAAFAIPILERIEDGAREVRAIVLAPTRELALQVAAETEKLATHRDVSVVAVYGGVGLGPQADALRDGAEIVVGTPGRVLDHIRRGNMDLSKCQMACLDEADEMLSMGFLEDVGNILKNVPDGMQMLLFSATVEADLKRLIETFAGEPEQIFLSTDTRTVEGVDHVLYETSADYPKPRQLMSILEMETPDAGIIFTNTRDDAAMLGAFLSRQGIDAEFISSDLSQKARERVMGRIKRGEIRFLIATDIAARGIDVSDLTHVINYSLPEDPAIYLHRVGRTARIGKTGTAISLMSGRELNCRGILERTWGIDFEIKELPSLEDAKALGVERHVAELEDAMQRMAWEAYLDMARGIQERPDGNRLIAAALRGFFIWSRMDTRRRAAEARGEEYDENDQQRQPRRGGSRFGGGRSGGRSGGRGRRDGGRGDGRGDRGRPRRDGDRRPAGGGDGPRGGGEGDAGKKRRRRRRKGGGQGGQGGGGGEA